MRQTTGQVNNLMDITYVKRIDVGSVNPNSPLSDEAKEKQVQLLNKCLNDYPKGKIIGQEVTMGAFNIGGHQLMMQKITYHVGFKRKPFWLKE